MTCVTSERKQPFLGHNLLSTNNFDLKNFVIMSRPEGTRRAGAGSAIVVLMLRREDRVRPRFTAERPHIRTASSAVLTAEHEDYNHRPCRSSIAPSLF